MGEWWRKIVALGFDENCGLSAGNAYLEVVPFGTEMHIYLDGIYWEIDVNEEGYKAVRDLVSALKSMEEACRWLKS